MPHMLNRRDSAYLIVLAQLGRMCGNFKLMNPNNNEYTESIKTISHKWDEFTNEVITNGEYLKLIADKELHRLAKDGDTKAKKFKRIVFRPIYDGKIEKGKEYVILDDVYTMGGTINSLKNFIEDNGGKVVAITTLTAGVDNDKIIGIQDETVEKLKELDKDGKIKSAIHELDIAENFESLTEPFVKYILEEYGKILNEARSRRAQSHSKTNV